MLNKVKRIRIDKSLFLGIGIGILIAVVFLNIDSRPIDKAEIERRALSYGMHYEDQCKVIFK